MTKRQERDPDDQLLWECIRDRETASWRNVIHLFHRVIALAVIRTLKQPLASNPDIVDDLIQSVYVRLCDDNCRILRKSRGEQPASIFALVKAVAVTTTLDYLRVPSNRTPLEPLISAEKADSRTADVIERECLINQIEEVLIERCRKAGQALDNCRERLIFWLRYRQGCTAKEIATLPSLSLSARGVESLLSRVVTELKQHFSKARKGHSL